MVEVDRHPVERKVDDQGNSGEYVLIVVIESQFLTRCVEESPEENSDPHVKVDQESVQRVAPLPELEEGGRVLRNLLTQEVVANVSRTDAC